MQAGGPNIAVRPIRQIPLLLELPRLQLQAKRTSSAISKCIDLKEACDNYSWHCHVGSRVRDQPKLLGKTHHQATQCGLTKA